MAAVRLSVRICIGMRYILELIFLSVYAGLAALCILIFVNIAPFAHQIHSGLYLSVVIVFIIALTYSWTAFPFEQSSPLKVFFQQSVQLDLSGSISGSSVPQPIIEAKTLLTGVPGYVDTKIIRELPSSWGKDIQCGTDMVLRPGLRTCSWQSDLIPSPGGSDSLSGRWITFSAERVNASAGRFTIGGTNTRSCALAFDHPISAYNVLNGGGRLQPGYEMPKGGVKEIALYSRTWDKAFEVEVAWAVADEDFSMTGRAACEWAEYASGTAGGPHANVSAQIPALEEVLHNLPLWATVTKWNVGLVEAWTKFSI